MEDEPSFLNHIDKIRTSLSRRIRETTVLTWLWLLPLVVAVVHYSPNSFRITADMAHYLVEAMHIATGQGYLSQGGAPILSRGPVFPGFIAIGLLLFNFSYYGAFFVVKVFAIGNAVLVYFLGRHVFDYRVGLVAGLLVAGSPTIRQVSLRHIDPVFAFFLLLFILTASIAYHGDDLRLYVLAGATLGVAFLTKEAAVLLFPLPLCLGLADRYRDVDRTVETGALYTALFVVLLPWAVYVYAEVGSLYPLTGGKAERVITGLSSGSTGDGGVSVVDTIVTVMLFPLVFLKGLVQYHLGYVIERLAYGLLVVPGWFYALYRWYRENRYVAPLVFSSILLVPLLVFVSRTNFRAGQTLLYYLLSAIVVSALILRGFTAVLDGTAALSDIQLPEHSRDLLTIVVVSVVVLGSIVVVVDAGSGTTLGGTFADSTVVDRATGGDGSVTFGGKFGNPTADWAAAWLSKNAQSGATYYAVNPAMVREVYFKTRGAFDNAAIPFAFTQFRNRGEYKFHGSRRGMAINNTADDDLLFLTSHYPHWTPRNQMRFLTQQDMLTRIENAEVEYVIVGARWSFMGEYFESHPGFEKEARMSGGAGEIYRVTGENMDAIPFRVHVTRRTTRFMQDLRGEHPEKYRWLRDDFMREFLGLNRTAVGDIENATYDRRVRATSYW